MKSKEQNGKPNEKTPVDWYKIQPVIEVSSLERIAFGKTVIS